MSDNNLLRKVGSDHPIYKAGWLINTSSRQRPVKDEPDVENPGDESTGDESDGLPTSQKLNSEELEEKGNL